MTALPPPTCIEATFYALIQSVQNKLHTANLLACKESEVVHTCNNEFRINVAGKKETAGKRQRGHVVDIGIGSLERPKAAPILRTLLLMSYLHPLQARP